jgi:hypothetical protein
MAQLVAFLDRRGTMDETSLIRAFRDWLRVQFDIRGH